MKNKLIFTCLLFALISFNNKETQAQIITESKLKESIAIVNKELKGKELDNGLKVRGCKTEGRTIIYSYDITSNWRSENTTKRSIIKNYKSLGIADTYFKNGISTDHYIWDGLVLKKKISIQSYELSQNGNSLGEYLSVFNHEKSKGVNFKIKVPIGWNVMEGNRPNAVKKFVKDDHVFTIVIKDNSTFFSRKESRDVLNDKDFSNEFIQEIAGMFDNSEIIEKDVISIDSYPTLFFKIKGKVNYSGVKLNIISHNYFIIYEDKIISMGGLYNDGNYSKNIMSDKIFKLMSSSLILPDQYN